VSPDVGVAVGEDDDRDVQQPTPMRRAPISALRNMSTRRIFVYTFLGMVGLSGLHFFAVTQMDAQAMMLETLKCTTDILDELHIQYFIDTGTLLGSIRHGGFISPQDREDVDLGILRDDEPKLLAMKHLTWERCGFPMIHRTDRQYLPGWLPVVIRRAAFRVFHGYLIPIYYLDIRDYEVVDGRLLDVEFLADNDTGNFTMNRIFPLKRCKFEHLNVSCPQDPEYVLEEEFGLDWRIPKKGFKTFMIDPALKAPADGGQ